MGLLDIFKQKNSVPEKVKTCEKTDSGANMVKEIREEILQKTAIPYMRLQLTDTKPSLFDSKVGGIGYVPRDAKIPEDSKGCATAAAGTDRLCRDHAGRLSASGAAAILDSERRCQRTEFR